MASSCSATKAQLPWTATPLTSLARPARPSPRRGWSISAAQGQTAPLVAQGGGIYLAAWVDFRTNLHVDVWRNSDLYARRVDVSPPPAPTMNAEPTWTQGDSNQVSWLDGGPDVARYEAQRAINSTFTSGVQTQGDLTGESATFGSLNDGQTYYYHVRAQDAQGNWSDWSAPVHSTQDASNPTLTFGGQAPATWYKDPASEITVAANDTGSGAACVRVNWGSQPLSCSGSLTSVSTDASGQGDGQHTLYAFAKDQVGNPATASRTYWVDTTPPAAPIMNAEPAYTPDGSNTVAWSAVSDGGVGGVQYKARRSTSSNFATNVLESLWQTSRSYPFGGLGNCQTYYYQVRSRDGLGNQSGWSAYVSSTQDGSAPTGSVSINGGNAWTRLRAVTLNLTAADNCVSASALEMCISESGSCSGNWEPFAASRAWTLSSGDGAKTVYVQFRDPAGKTSSLASDSIGLDTNAPVIDNDDFYINDHAVWTSNRAVVLTLDVDVDDNGGSGVNRMRFSNDGVAWSAWELFAGTRAYTLPEGDGAKTVYAQVRDAAMNVSNIASDDINLDTTPPPLMVNDPLPGDVQAGRSLPILGQSELGASIEALVLPGGSYDYISDLDEGVDFSFYLVDALQAGPNTVIVTATDDLGNFTTVQRQVTLDQGGPVVTNMTPQGVIAQAQPTLAADFSEPIDPTNFIHLHFFVKVSMIDSQTISKPFTEKERIYHAQTIVP